MKKYRFILFLILTFVFLQTQAQYPASVITFKSEPNKIISLKSNLSKGSKMKNLTWASRSSTACFPGTQNSKFNGNHVLFATNLPPYSEMYITLIPDNKNANMSIYAYQVGTNNFVLPPDLSSCVSCEAEHKQDYAKRGKTQDHTRTVRLNAIKNPYNVVIGVAGADGLTKGGFTLKINLKTRVTNTGEQKPLKLYTIQAVKGTTKAYKGNLKDGVKIYDLSWAAKSNVACFPATQNSKFTGNHVNYVTEIPPHSVMDIEIIPTDKHKNMSLYAYQTGVSNKSYPPNLSSCISCEADYKWDYAKRGKTQNHSRKIRLNAVNNAYRVVIGVAGADGLTDGEFIIRISVK